MKKRIIASILSLCIIFTSGLFTNAENLNISDTYSFNESKSLKSYSKIIEYFQKSSVKTYSTKNTSSNNELINCYGGSFIDSDGKLNINLVKNTYSLQEEINQIANDDTLIYNKCNYSYNELRNVYDQICEHINEYNITEVSIIESKNKVIVYGENINEISNKLTNIINTNAVEFQELNSQYSKCATYDLKAGEYVSSDIYESTIGFCGKDENGNKGIIIAGHAVNAIGNTVYNSNGKKIGTVTKRKESGNVDAAFVKIENGLFAKFNATYQLSDGSNIWSWLPSSSIPEGTQLKKYGITTGQTSGKVITNTTTFTVGSITHTDVVRTSIYAQPGDSGGPVIKTIPTTSENCLVGTCMGIATYSNGTVELYFTKIDNIINWSGVTPILCP